MVHKEAESNGSWALINDELSARLERQDRSLSRVELKATIVVGFAATAAQFLASRNPFDSALTSLLAVLAFSSYSLAFVVGVWAMRITRYKDFKADPLYAYGDRPETEVQHRLAASRRDFYNDGVRVTVRKVVAWWFSVSFLAVGLLLSGVALVQT